MRKLLITTAVVGSFLFVGAGTALANFINDYVYVHNYTAPDTDANSGLGWYMDSSDTATNFSYTYQLTNPFIGTSPTDPLYYYDPVNDHFDSASLVLYFADDSDPASEAFQVSLVTMPTGSGPGSWNTSFGVVGVDAAFSPDGNLTYYIHAKTNDFYFR